jgi:hypothetical protein
MKYCCDRFEAAHNLPNYYGLNIRVVKFNNEDLLDKIHAYRYFITPGYEDADTKIPAFSIAFCPFCGTNLFSFYGSDEWVNETKDKF